METQQLNINMMITNILRNLFMTIFSYAMLRHESLMAIAALIVLIILFLKYKISINIIGC